MFQYVNYPKIPDFLLETPTIIIGDPIYNTGSVGIDYPYFQSRKVKIELLDWIQKNIWPDGFAQYQVIRNGLHRHIDAGGRKRALNYIIDTGGVDVHTNHYHQDGSIMHTVCIEPFRWHMLRTDVLHDVTGITGTRVSLSIGIEKV